MGQQDRREWQSWARVCQLLEQDARRKGWAGIDLSYFTAIRFCSSNLGNFEFRFSDLCFQILKKCGYFEWMDNYLERLLFEGYIDSMKGLPPVGVEMGESSEMGAPDADREGKRNARYGELPGLPSESEVNQELKKIKKHLKQMVDLQKQANMMTGGFYCCIVALFFVYLLIRR